MPSLQDGAAQREPTQCSDWQSASTLQALPISQPTEQLSPQSTAGSRPFAIPSVQLEAPAQPGPEHKGTTQAVGSSPGEQLARQTPFTHSSPPPQSLADTQHPGALAQVVLELGTPATLATSSGALSRPVTSLGLKSSCVKVQETESHNAPEKARASRLRRSV
jgi:hypothetical protein